MARNLLVFTIFRIAERRRGEEEHDSPEKVGLARDETSKRLRREMRRKEQMYLKIMNPGCQTT